MRYTLDDFGIVNGLEFSNSTDYKNNAEQLINGMMTHYTVLAQELELTLDEYSITARGIDDKLYYFKAFMTAAYSDKMTIPHMLYSEMDQAIRSNISCIYDVNTQDNIQIRGAVDLPHAYRGDSFIELCGDGGSEMLIDFEKMKSAMVLFDGNTAEWHFGYENLEVTLSFLY